MGVVSAVFWGVVVLSLLVFLHEGGHFLAARACGMRVTEFYLGMPCRHHLARKSRTYGTEFGVTPILLGGYTRICGMEGTHDDLLPDCFGIVQREGRVLATDVAAELG
ncbi:site-2 protease family protein, partial [Parafannyhessea umbonata]